MTKLERRVSVTTGVLVIGSMCYAGLYTALGIKDLKETGEKNTQSIHKIEKQITRIETKLDLPLYEKSFATYSNRNRFSIDSGL